jgi:glycosyltransferase
MTATKDDALVSIDSTLPSISIITVALNSAKTIGDALASINRQLYPAQLIVVDGASNDETASIAGTFLKTNDVLISEKDKDMYDALNTGIALATGDIIGTLNADDFYPHSRVLSVVLEQFQDPDVDACYGDLIYVDRNDISCIKRYWKSSRYNDTLFRLGWMPPHPTFFARRHIYEKCGHFRTDCGTASDYELLLRFFLKHRIRTHYIPHVLVVMRTGGMSNVNLRNRWDANKMDRKAWEINRLKMSVWTTLLKPFSKARQFFFIGHYNKQWLDPDWPHESGVQVHHAPSPNPLSPGARENHSSLIRPTPEGEGEADSLPFYTATVNYHSEPYLQRLSASLINVSALKELIVVDHSGTLVRDALPKAVPTRVVSQPNRGFGAGINAGMSHIPYRDGVVLICNPDIEILNPDQLPEVIKKFKENPRLAAVAPSIINSSFQLTHSCRRFYSWGSAFLARLPYFRNQPERYRRRYFCMDKDLSESFDVEWCSGSAIFLRLRYFPFPISFDERFFLYFEDVDLCAQIHKHELIVRYDPKIVFIHHEQRASAEDNRFFALHLQSMFRFIIKYRGFPTAEKLQQGGSGS